MAEYGEWNRKGTTLSDATAQKEYGVSRDFILGGIQSGRLEYREGAIWGNPYLRILRSQLERYIVAEYRVSLPGEQEAPERIAYDQNGNGGSEEKTG